jgi:hypothetical protein
MIAAVVKDILLNADAAQNDPKFFSGRFAVACRGCGDDLRATVERLAREGVEHRFVVDPIGVSTLLTYSDKTRTLVFTQMIAEVVKRLVVSSEAT